MYLTFYNLKKEPFHITPDPEFLYLSPSHKEALAAIIYGIEQRKGFVAIIGAVGTGKTTILRTYLESDNKNRTKIIYIFNARLTFEGLLKTIYQELGIEAKKGDIFEMINNLYKVLIDEFVQGNCVVLVIDEAQNMPIDSLENLRMLSNLETSKDKLIQIVLVGQPEFEEALNLNSLRQLKQRIAIQATILPLSKNESLEYIEHRFQKAGARSESVFMQDALNLISNKAGGIPRVINIMCDNALITGFGYQQKLVTSKIVREVIHDLEGRKRQPVFKWRPAYGFTALVLIIGVVLAFYYGNLSSMKPALKGSSDKNIAAPVETKISPKMSPRAQHESVERRTEGQPVTVTQSPVGLKESTPAPVSPEVSTRSKSPNQAGPGEERQVARKRAFARQKDTVKPLRDESSQGSLREGDTPAQSAQDVSGRSDGKLITLIQGDNPRVVDPNLIVTGSKINFPKSTDE